MQAASWKHIFAFLSLQGIFATGTIFDVLFWLTAQINHRRGPWRTFEAVQYATLEWVDWYNHRRLLEPIENIPLALVKANFKAALERSDMAA